MSVEQTGYLLLTVGCCIWPLLVHGFLLWVGRGMRGLRGLIPDFIERWFLR